MKSIINCLTNTKTMCALISLALVIANEFVEIDRSWVEYVVNTIATILIALGVFNKDGMETNKWDK